MRILFHKNSPRVNWGALKTWKKQKLARGDTYTFTDVLLCSGIQGG